MTKMRFSFWSSLVQIALSLLFAGGCGSSALPSAANPLLARESLQAMLDSWQRGERAEELKNRSPAIVAIDDDWRSGLRLTNYEVKTDVPHGVGLQTSVLLSLLDDSGRAFQKEATYTIG